MVDNVELRQPSEHAEGIRRDAGRGRSVRGNHYILSRMNGEHANDKISLNALRKTCTINFDENSGMIAQVVNQR